MVEDDATKEPEGNNDLDRAEKHDATKEPEGNNDLDRAEKLLEERKKVVEEEKKILDRKEKVTAIQIAGGHTVAGKEDEEPKKEETNHEYRVRVEKEIKEGKTEFGN